MLKNISVITTTNGVILFGGLTPISYENLQSQLSGQAWPG